MLDPMAQFDALCEEAKLYGLDRPKFARYCGIAGQTMSRLDPDKRDKNRGVSSATLRRALSGIARLRADTVKAKEDAIRAAALAEARIAQAEAVSDLSMVAV